MLINMEEGRKIDRVVYSPIVGDIFHYGHLKLLKFANSQGDYHICGVLSDKAAKDARNKPISNLDERLEVVKNLRFVDEAIVQDQVDPTENLKKIHERFMDAKLILVYGSGWKEVPGADYIKEINGEIKQPTPELRISEVNIINRLLEEYRGKFRHFEEFTNYFRLKDFIYYDKEKARKTIVSTKADTLRSLFPFLKKSKVEKTFVFTSSEWDENKGDLLLKIKKEFNPGKIAVRSSALNEDTFQSSMAGRFYTELNVKSDDMNKIEGAIKRVVESYKDGNFENPLNQILIQSQTENIKLSGVIFTRTIENNAPYYVINYDDTTNLTNRVTSGFENKTVKISRFCKPEDYPGNFIKLFEAVKEIEDLIPGIALDIEFAVTKDNDVVIFQVRPIAAKHHDDEVVDNEIRKKVESIKTKFFELSRKKEHISGDFNCFGDMPDWNPAEIIGDNPNHLSYSLYDYIITNDIWHKARSSQGYNNVNPARLVVLFGNKPYVDVRNTFNSFIPNSIDRGLREKLVHFYMNKLKKNPELQDKVEFDIVYTCYDLTFDKRGKELIESGFTKEEVEVFKRSLIELTNKLVNNSDKDIDEDMNAAIKMEESRKKTKEIMKNLNEPKDLVKQAVFLLDDCKENGTLQFSRVARLAFIGKILLKSMVKEKIIDQKFYDNFLNSINTVATEINSHFNQLVNGKLTQEDFLERYGHLRPGTYDITSLRYDKNHNIFNNANIVKNFENKKSGFVIDKEIHEKVSKTLKENGLDFNSEKLFEFIQESLEGRELLKFEFSKNLSQALELISDAGKFMGFTREELANLDVETLIDFAKNGSLETKEFWKNLIEVRKQERTLNNKLSLPSVIFSQKDFDVVPYYMAKPNFITNKKIESEIVDLSKMEKENLPDLRNKIVILENGDPGYDWIFTKDIAGLVTKYGGVASHMAVRCAEFGIPAAIGCGESFENFKNSSSIFE